MNCPYCTQKLTQTTTKTKAGAKGEVWECFSCGGHWFPRWLANDVGLEVARTLDSVLAKLTVAPPEEPRCPVCQTRLSIIKHDAVATGIVVWSCPEGDGNFFPKGELSKFKEAQDAKISYHKLWGVPIRSVFAILLPVAAVFALAGGLPILLEQLQTSQETRTRAGATFSTPLVTVVNGSSVLISFTTSAPVTTSLTLYQDGVFYSTRVINTSPASLHSIQLEELLPSATYTYTLTLTDETGEMETTDPIFLNFAPTPK